VRLFQEGIITEDTLLADVRNVGPMIQGRLSQINLNSINDLVDYFAGDSTTEMNDKLSRLTLNARANQCVIAQGAKVRAFLVRNGHAPDADIKVRYHVCDTNKYAFNTIRNIIRYAKYHPASFNYGFRMHNPPKARGPRPEQASYCGCNDTKKACAQFPNSCQWKQQGQYGLCVPLNPDTYGFEGGNGFNGQKFERGTKKSDGGAV